MSRRGGRTIRVRVVARRDRKFLVLRWVDRKGVARERTTQTTRRRLAEREAALLAEELAQADSDGLVSRDVYRVRYDDERLDGMKPKSRAIRKTALGAFEDLLEPKHLQDADAAAVSRFAALLRTDRDLETPSIACYLRELRAALRWAARIFPGYVAPTFDIPKLPKGKRMKGRPITLEEFERMLTATPKVVGEQYARGWRRLLRGLWLSGLRLGEALAFSWDDRNTICVVDLEAGRRRWPKLSIPSEAEKGSRNRILPMTPDFATWLRRVPPEKRRGRVFRPRLSRGRVRLVETASAVIADIGRKAGIRTGNRRVRKHKAEDPATKPKYATAHDLRRAFGTRWATRLRPPVLQMLMRHESIETTMQYYVGLDADRIGEDLWREFGDQTGDKQAKRKRRRRS